MVQSTSVPLQFHHPPLNFDDEPRGPTAISLPYVGLPTRREPGQAPFIFDREALRAPAHKLCRHNYTMIVSVAKRTLNSVLVLSCSNSILLFQKRTKHDAHHPLPTQAHLLFTSQRGVATCKYLGKHTDIQKGTCVVNGRGSRGCDPGWGTTAARQHLYFTTFESPAGRGIGRQSE
jgi:hypothetical protein